MGVYYLREGRDLIAAIEEQMARKHMLKGEFFLADAFNVMLEKGARFVTERMTVWQDCGVPRRTLQPIAGCWIMAAITAR